MDDNAEANDANGVSHRDWLAERFEIERPHLRAVAYRMLGAPSEAEDAVQESWLRLSRSDVAGVGNLSGWLTTVVARVCLDMLRTRAARREEPLESLEMPGEPGGEPGVTRHDNGDPEHEALLADAVGLALLVVLDTLKPSERLAFVLHDLFDVPFDEIAPIVGRTPLATRKLASRARRRVQGAGAAADADTGADEIRQRRVVTAFLAAARAGDFDALLALLDPGVTLRADAAAAAMGVESEVHGAREVAQQFAGRAHAAQVALVDGAAGLVWVAGRTSRVVIAFTLADGKVVSISLIADPERLRQLDVEPLDS